MSKLFCKRCKKIWEPRKNGKPDQCPRCHSPFWDQDYSRSDMVHKNRTIHDPNPVGRWIR